MKKIVSITLLLVLCLGLVACGGKESAPFTGAYTHGGNSYVFYDGSGGKVLAYGSGEYSTPSILEFSHDDKNVVLNGNPIAKSDLTAKAPAALSGDSHGLVLGANGHITGTVAKDRTAYVLPTQASVVSAGAFEGSETRAILITEGDELTLDNGALRNDHGLAVIISSGVDPNKLVVAKGLLDGTENVTFYIAKADLSTFKSHYNWANFKDLMVGY